MSHSVTRKPIVVVPFALLTSAAIVAHVYLGTDADRATGLLALLDHIFDLVVALGLLTITLCVGNSLGHKLKVRFSGVAEEISFSIFLGTGVVGLLILLLGLLTMLRPLPVA